VRVSQGNLKEKKMEHNQSVEIEEIKGGSAEDLSQTWIKEDCRRLKTSLGFKLPGQALGFWGVRVFFLIVVSPFLFGCGNGESKEELIFIETRLDQVEERLTKLAEVEERLTQLEGTEQKMAHLESQIEKLERSISELNRLVASRTKEDRYHEVRQGDSLFKIAQKNGITVEELCFLNKITAKTVIRPGQKLLVAR
jgi:flagellar motility protein MotE (MotC chaperone)